MNEDQRLELEDLLPKDPIIWADDSELDWWKDDPWTYRKWALVAGHGPMANGKGCERCGYDTSQCMFAVFHDAMVATVIRELDKLGFLLPPSSVKPPASPDRPSSLQPVAIRAPARSSPSRPRTPCAEGFHWIGQSFAYCDRCGLPAWEHEGYAELPEGTGPFGTDEWVLRPWKPGERDAIRQTWDTSTTPTT